MKIVRYVGFGDPADVIEVAEASMPEPGEGEVRVRLEASPIHLADLKHIHGLPWFDQFKPPATPGFEGVGRVSGVGRGVTAFREGDRVFLPMRFGAWAEEVVAAENDVWAAPESLPAEQLALIPINFTTAWLMLDSIVPLGPGDWLIQNAANSNVAYYIVRLCRRRGIRTVNVVRRSEPLARLEAAGGDVNLVDGDDLAERVSAVVPAGRLKLALDAVAGQATSRLASCFSGQGGTVASYGLLSGEPCMIPPEMLILGAVTLTGFYPARVLERMGADEIRSMRAEMLEALDAEPPDAPIAGVYPFDEVRAALAHAAAEGAAREGKIILVP